MLQAEDLRFILGLKVKALRTEQHLSLKDVAQKAGLSVSYLSEIEQGRKYPKPDKLIDLAGALGVTYEALVSLAVGEELDPLKAVFTSPLVRQFPFEVFGLEPERIVGLLRDDPARAGSLVSALAELGTMHGVGVPDFLLAAMRSYQQMHGNYFPELEDEADRFRTLEGFPHALAEQEQFLLRFLQERCGYTLDQERLPQDPDLRGFRSVFVPGAKPVLYLNPALSLAQRVFVLAREVGFELFKPDERPLTSSWVEVTSFQQLLGNHEASYFAGALLLGRGTMGPVLRDWASWPTWSDARFAELIRGLHLTPEMIFYRLTQLIPQVFGISELLFIRVQHQPGSEEYRVTKLLNQTRMPLAVATELNEHRCRRWVSAQLARSIVREGRTLQPGDVAVRAQRTHFFERSTTFFSIAVARTLALQPGRHSLVTFGMRYDETFMSKMKFARDANVPEVPVNFTCERCPLLRHECAERASPPVHVAEELAVQRKRLALKRLGVD